MNGAEALITRSSIGGGAGTSSRSASVRWRRSPPSARTAAPSIPRRGRCTATSCSARLHGRTTSGGARHNGRRHAVASISGFAGRRRRAQRDLRRAGRDRAVGRAHRRARRRAPSSAATRCSRGRRRPTSHGVWMDALRRRRALDRRQRPHPGRRRRRGASRRRVRRDRRLPPGDRRQREDRRAAARARPRAPSASRAAPRGQPSSRCVVVGNKLIQGSPSTIPRSRSASRCDGGRLRARRGQHDQRHSGGGAVVGLSLRRQRRARRAQHHHGRLRHAARPTGVLAEDASARIENNLVRGAACANNLTTAQAFGLHVHVAAGANEVDVHSNTDRRGRHRHLSAARRRCIGTSATGTKAPRGIFRNNILRAGACAHRALRLLGGQPAGRAAPLREQRSRPDGPADGALPAEGEHDASRRPRRVNALPGAGGQHQRRSDVRRGAARRPPRRRRRRARTPARRRARPRRDFDGKAARRQAGHRRVRALAER